VLLMAGVNKAILVGNVGRDPEIRTLNNGNQVASFSLATSESWRDRNSGERKEKTEWHRISVFQEGLVKVVSDYVRKGSKLYLEGKIETRKWTDNAGQERFTTEIVLSGFDGKLQMLDSRRDGEAAGGGRGDVYEPPHRPARSNRDVLDDDIPF
jgi:single-strand DNA-binding protein